MIHYEFVNLQVCHWQTQLQMIHVIVKYFFFLLLFKDKLFKI